MKLTLALPVFVCLFGLAATSLPSDAFARAHHAKKTHAVHHKTKKSKKARRAARPVASPLATAQQQLATLGFYTGKIDGKNGPQTRAAIKAFQRENGLAATGKLDAKTRQRLSEMTTSLRGIGIRQGAMMGATPLVPYAAPATDVPQNTDSRYGKLDLVSDAGTYTITFNGAPIYAAQNQNIPVKLSPVYDIDGEDILLVTAYVGVPQCPYQTALIAIHPNGRTEGAQILPACTAEHNEALANGMLDIRFANGHDGRNEGTGYRYDHGNINPML